MKRKRPNKDIKKEWRANKDKNKGKTQVSTKRSPVSGRSFKDRGAEKILNGHEFLKVKDLLQSLNLYT